MSEVGQVELGVRLNSSSFSKQMNGFAKNSSTNNALKGAFTSLGKMAGVALGTAAIASFTKSCLDLGSNLSEVQNVVDTTFKTMSNSVNQFANTALTEFGLSETVTKKYMGTLGAMSKSMGLTESASFEMSKAVTSLAGDVASFYNLSTDEAYDKLKSIWTGETETLKSLGVMLTQTNLDQYALNNGFGKTTQTMTEQEKLLLRYQYTLSSLSDAQGDFAKTSNSWANQTRLLSLQWDSFKASIGQGLINVLSPLLKMLNNLVSKLGTAATAFKNFTSTIFGDSAADNNIGMVSEDTTKLTGDLMGAVSATEDLKKSLQGFDKINKISDDSGYDSTSAGNESASNSGQQKTESTVGKLNSISFANLDESLSGLSKSFSKLSDSIGKNVKFIFDKMLVPLSTWAVNDALPAFIDALSNAMSLLSAVIEDFRPFGEWLWDNFLEPIAAFTGGIVVGTLENLADVFEIIAKNDKLRAVLEGAALGLASIVAVKNLEKTIALLGSLSTKLASLGAMGKVAVVVTVALAGLELGEKINELLTGDEVDYSLNDYLEPSLEEYGDAIWACFEDIGSSFEDWWSDFCDDLVTPIVDSCKTIWNGIKAAFSGIGSFFSNLWTGVKNIFSNVGSWFSGVFAGAANGIKAAFSGIGSFFSGIWTGITDVFSSVGSWFSGVFTGAADGIKAAFSGIGSFFSGIWTGITDVFSSVGSWFSGVFTGAANGIKAAFSGIAGFFSGLWTKIKGVFSDIGTKVGEVIGGAFKAVINAVLATIEGVINTPIYAINGLISAINCIPGVDLDKLSTFDLPRLAQGGYVKPNTPQLAMIGDNRHQGEVVAPEDKLAEMAREAAGMAGNIQLTKEVIALLRQIIDILKHQDRDVYIDGEKATAKISRIINEHTMQTGVCEIIT